MRIDLDRYAERARRLDVSGVDFDAFRDQPLAPDVLRCLRYMHDVEHHTICYLRDLLVTPAHRDPRVTTFLTVWSYEEMWHGDAIGRVLAAHGEDAGVPRVAALRRGLGGRDRLAPTLHALGAAVAGRAFGALHMTWGAVNEWTTQAGYARLLGRAQHPVLTDLLNRIMRQEGNHIAFYASEADERLSSHPRARRVVRGALRRLWRPVGAGVMPGTEVAFLIQTLFGDPDGRAAAARIDRRIDQLPGLSNLDLVTGAVDRYAGASPGPGGRIAGAA
ncbi:MAG TPA: hypothetical protein VFI47_27045 [Acidimicrobiales bacterium]|nr:hypothetical protein [Acidimicrobiales bacterium]